jgi:hypothetical protein
VFRWNNFPEPRFGTEKKARWFIYLGESGPFFKPTIAYISTTTTNINEFKKGGSLQSHDYCVFSAKTSPFEEDCILDYDNQPYSPLREKLLNNADIEIKGKFDTNTMKMIYNRLIKSSAISPIILQDIHESFNRAGITGLRKIR